MSVYEIVNYEEVYDWLLECHKASDVHTKNQLKKLIIVACLPLVRKIAKGLARRSTDPIEDIIQVGNIGLIKAVSFYNPELSQNFKSYATYLITGEIKHYVRDKIAMIKPPRQIQELAYRINSLTKELTEQLGVTPTDEQLAQKMSVPVNKIHEVIEEDRRKFTISLDQVVNDGDDGAITLNDKIADENYQNSVNLQEDKIILKNAIKKLQPIYREVIEMSFFEDMTQKSIGEKLNISQIQVSRYIKKALEDLHNLMTQKLPDIEVK